MKNDKGKRMLSIGIVIFSVVFLMLVAGYLGGKKLAQVENKAYPQPAAEQK